MKRAALCGLIATMVLAGCGPTAGELRSQGIAQYQAGNHEQSRKLFQQCLDRDAGDADALFYMGRILHTRGDHIWALYYYQRCLDTDPSYEIARPWLARAQAKAGPSGESMIYQPLERP